MILFNLNDGGESESSVTSVAVMEPLRLEEVEEGGPLEESGRVSDVLDDYSLDWDGLESGTIDGPWISLRPLRLAASLTSSRKKPARWTNGFPSSPR